jgi:SIR2-like domain
MSLPELIDYLSKDRCLVFIGSGPSCQVGLPDWRGVALAVLEEVRLKNPKDVDKYEELFAQQQFLELLGRGWRAFSPSFILSIVGRVLTDPGTQGPAYEFLARFPFRGYLTTNLDSVLARHFDDAGIAATQFLNTEGDLRLVDFGELRCIVKIHGDYQSEGSVILTDDQYDALIYNSKYEYLRKFLGSYLTTS